MMELSPFWYGLYKLAKYAVYPLTWITLFLSLAALLAAFPASPGRIKWIRRFAAVSLLLLFVFSNRIITHTLLGLIEERVPSFDRSTVKRFDAIVVLGGGVAHKGTLRPTDELSSAGLERTLCGVDLLTKGFAPKLVLAGGDGSIFGSNTEEATVMKLFALQLGAHKDSILLENRSRNTYENAVETKRLLGNASILLVTSAIHVPRALGLFRKQGVEATPYACGYLAQDLPWSWTSDPFDLIPDVTALYLSTEALSEVVGTIVYRVAGKL
jgi:uncharacterized SAM-binding protein YcdF (DUF218 family)